MRSSYTHISAFRALGSRQRAAHFVCLVILGFLVAAAPFRHLAAQQASSLFTTQEVEKTFPPSVYYRGKSAPIQLRNAAAAHLGSNGVFFAGLVDTSGYASGIQETYQMYLLTEQPTRLGTAAVPAGAYGAGFIGDKLVVMDLGGHLVAEGKTQLDEGMTRPRPLQLIQSADGMVRLYLGRHWVEVRAENH